MKNRILIFFLFILFSTITYSQVFENPIAAKQSHPKLEINRIEITDSSTIISLKVTNKRNQGGWFCADESIHIKNSIGTEVYELVKSENIPTCPDQHEFAYTGEVLEFNLYFEKISDTIKFIDLIENCDNACFSFHRIILNNEHNEKIRAFENGFDLYQKNEFEKSTPYFEKVLDGNVIIQSQINGLAYYYLILIYKNIGDTEKVNIWYKKLLNSDIQDKETFIKELEGKIDIQ
ncbi:MAG: DUF4919 domain-containing protein [Bacteroidales bacterium]|nr:DUF4919 domain-containing protein [Bacteroidales bacterium]